MRSNKAMLAALAAALFAGCTTAPSTPPVELLRACAAPESDIITNADLARHALALRAALQECDDDKAVLRLWVQDTKDSDG